MGSLLCSKDGGMARLVRQLRQAAGYSARTGLNLLFPPRCACCGADLAEKADPPALCGVCCERLIPPHECYCRRCGAIGVDDDGSADDCPWCRKARLHFDAVVPLGLYQGLLHRVVLRMKTTAGEALTAAMGELLLRHRGPDLAQLPVDAIIPIPMHWTRRLWRGTNSPEVLARCWARYLRVPVRRVLIRRRNTLPQSKLKPPERFSNVRGAFGVHRPDQLRGKRVLLVDDILTTGATCSAAAQLLKHAGAAMVAVAVLARGQGADTT